MAGIQDLILQSLQGSIKAENAAMDQEDALTRILGELGVLNRQTTAAVDKKTAASNVVEQTALAGEQAAQDATRTFARAAGTDITTPEDILVSLGQDMRASVEAARAAQADIQAKESAPILDNPLKWLAGQVTLQQSYQQYNQAAEKANLASASITDLTHVTDAVGRTQAGIAKKVTDASRIAVAEARLADAEATKIAATRGHLKDEVTVVNAIQNATAEQANQAARQFGIVRDARQIELEEEKFRMYKEQWSLEVAAKKLATKDKEESDAVSKHLLEQYNIGARLLGYPEETNLKLVLARAELGGTDKTRISAIMEAGGNSIATGANTISSNPAVAASLAHKKLIPRLNTDPAFAPMQKYLTEKFGLELINQGGKEDAALLATKEHIKRDEKAFTDNAVATGSFYAPPPIAAITATKSVQSTALYKKVLSTAGKDLTTAEPAPILKLTYAAVKQGVLTPEEATVGLNEFYGQASNINNATKKYSQVGIASQNSFNVYPDVVGPNNVKVNLMDYNSTLRLFAIARARELSTNIGPNLLIPTVLPGYAPFGAQDTTN